MDVEALAFFFVVAVVPCTYFYFRYRARQEVQHTLRLAVEHGKELTPELVQTISADLASGNRDLRRGVISLALAAATALLAWGVNEPEVMAVAAFPLMLGLAYLGLWHYDPGRRI